MLVVAFSSDCVVHVTIVYVVIRSKITSTAHTFTVDGFVTHKSKLMLLRQLFPTLIKYKSDLYQSCEAELTKDCITNTRYVFML